MKPYAQIGGATIYHGDAREIVSGLGLMVDAVITDPVWPKPSKKIAGHEAPFALLRDVMIHLPGMCRRIVIQMSCLSDPRILTAIPPIFEFTRTCWLELGRPIRMGRLLHSGDQAYIYGALPRSRVGSRVLPGKKMCAYRKRQGGHPCPRQLEHVQWLVHHFADGMVLDPFCGSGTALIAAEREGLPSIGIDIEENWCEEAALSLQRGDRQ